MCSIVVIGLFCEVVIPTGLSGPFQNREKAFYVFSFKSSRNRKRGKVFKGRAHNSLNLRKSY